MTFELMLAIAGALGVGAVLKTIVDRFLGVGDRINEQENEIRRELREDVIVLRADMKNLKAQNDGLVKANADLGARVITNEAKIETLIQRLTAVQMERDLLLKEIATLRQHVQGLDRRKIEGGEK